MSGPTRDLVPHRPGWWNMVCWNGLDAAQQTRLIEVGTLPIGYIPMGECGYGAEVAIETAEDKAPGPRFYCRHCAIEFLSNPCPAGGMHTWALQEEPGTGRTGMACDECHAPMPPEVEW